MLTKHFIKVFTIFVVMIALGLAGVYLINTYGQSDNPETASDGSVGVEARVDE